MKNIDIANSLIKLFKDNKMKIYLVGGSVRDYLLFGDFEDFDFATPEKIEDVAKILNIDKIDNYLLKFGNLKANYLGKEIEITRFRIDKNYKDHRHPSKIIFTKNMFIDSLRRDFTINSLYYNDNKIYDFHNGIKDLKNKIIRTIINPYISLSQDYLRILRAIRFEDKLGFNLSKKLSNSVTSLKNNLNFISLNKLKEEKLKFKNIQILDKYNITI